MADTVKKKRLVCITVDEPEITLLGREIILRNGEFAGYLCSAGFGYSVDKSICYGYVRNENGVTSQYLEKGDYQLAVAEKTIPAVLHLGALYDPDGLRIKL